MEITDITLIERLADIGDFKKVLFLKTIREDKLNDLVLSFVWENLGPSFIDFPSLDLKSSI